MGGSISECKEVGGGKGKGLIVWGSFSLKLEVQRLNYHILERPAGSSKFELEVDSNLISGISFSVDLSQNPE